MMRPLLGLVLTMGLLFAAPARALPSNVPYDAFVDGDFAGTLTFEPDAWIGAGACRYIATVDPGGGVPAQQCAFDEATWLGRFSCVANAEGPVPGLVVLTPGQYCNLYDGTGERYTVFSMLLGENEDGALMGIVQFTAASSTLSTFFAAPRAAR